MIYSESPSAIVSMGPYHCAARGPFDLAWGPVRSADDIALAENDCDEMVQIFSHCPSIQFGAAAQAAMSVRSGT